LSKSTLTLVELFSGIGSQAKSLQRVSKKYNKNVEVIGTCEWDIHAFLAYHFIHTKNNSKKITVEFSKDEIVNFLFDKGVSYNGKTKMTLDQIKRLNYEVLQATYQAIIQTNNFVNISNLHGTDLPKNIDILTYSFPCQDLSNVGNFHRQNLGIDKDANTRSGLLWEVDRLLSEIKEKNSSLPKFLIMENVASLKAPRHRGNFEIWKKNLEDLGYVNKDFKLNAMKFGVPQSRTRIIMISVLTEKKDLTNKVLDELEEKLNNQKIQLKPLEQYIDTSNRFFNENLEAQPNNTPSRIKIWDKNHQIYNKNNDFSSNIGTITTRQDRHPNSGNIFFKYEGNKKSEFRFLTARETFRLMGFDDKDYEVIISNNIQIQKNRKLYTRDAMYKLAGNSIVVEMLDPIFEEIIKLNELLFTS